LTSTADAHYQTSTQRAADAQLTIEVVQVTLTYQAANYVPIRVVNTPEPPQPTTAPQAPSGGNSGGGGSTGGGNGHPAGTTGQCNDGSYTSAAHSQGACSHHGGLAAYWG